MDANNISANGSIPGTLPDSFDQWPPLKDLMAAGRLLRKATSWGNSDTFVLHTCSGREYLLKTFSRHPLLIRKFLGRFSIRNEYHSLKHLENIGFQHAPRVYAMPDADSLLMEYIAGGTQLLKKDKYSAETMPAPFFFEKLIALMRELHRLGVCHGDFRRANILRLPDETPVLIDWATAMVKPANPGKCSLARLLFSVLSKSDLYSLAAMTESYYPHLLDQELQQYLTHQPWFLRLGRFLRQKVYRHFFKQLTGKKNIRQKDHSC